MPTHQVNPPHTINYWSRWAAAFQRLRGPNTPAPSPTVAPSPVAPVLTITTTVPDAPTTPAPPPPPAPVITPQAPVVTPPTQGITPPTQVVTPPTPVSAPDPVATAPSPSPVATMSAEEQQIIDLTNQQRVQNGLPPLTIDPRLIEAAQIHAGDMARLGQMEHDLPGAALPTLQDRAGFVGYKYAWLGENIAFNYADAASVVAGWMQSPGHRANILNPNFNDIGVGVALDSQGQPYYCQVFGSQLA